MAARAEEPLELEVMDLRHFQAHDLASLLDEEGRIWAEKLHWDFHSSAEVVRRYVDLRALNGYALLHGRMPVGYSYYVHEDHKVLIGDLFVSAPYRSVAAQHRLLQHVIETAQHTPGVRRIEAQLMMLESSTVESLFPHCQLSIFRRNFMLVTGIPSLRREMFGPEPDLDVEFGQWAELDTEETAELIARAYHSHVDSRINDQYRSVAGARRFLHNIIQYPGCGTFHIPAATMGVDGTTGRICGVCLASLVAAGVGHITQICVAPDLRGRGIGSELLWRSIQAFCRDGCEAVSLTVTADNAGAVRLYERIGFHTIRQFRAYVWEGF